MSYFKPGWVCGGKNEPFQAEKRKKHTGRTIRRFTSHDAFFSFAFLFADKNIDEFGKKDRKSFYRCSTWVTLNCMIIGFCFSIKVFETSFYLYILTVLIWCSVTHKGIATPVSFTNMYVTFWNIISTAITRNYRR